MKNNQRPPMKYRQLPVFLPLCACVVTACAPGTPAPDLAAEKRALLQRDKEWQAAVTEKKNVAKIVSYFASDGVMFGSEEPTDDNQEALTRAVAGLVADPLFKGQWTWSRVEL